jgi:hypothetical protein
LIYSNSHNAIDTAKDTYRNATVETMEMIKIIIADKKADFEERTLRAAHTSVSLPCNLVARVFTAKSRNWKK